MLNTNLHLIQKSAWKQILLWSNGQDSKYLKERNSSDADISSSSTIEQMNVESIDIIEPKLESE